MGDDDDDDDHDHDHDDDDDDHDDDDDDDGGDDDDDDDEREPVNSDYGMHQGKNFVFDGRITQPTGGGAMAGYGRCMSCSGAPAAAAAATHHSR